MYVKWVIMLAVSIARLSSVIDYCLCNIIFCIQVGFAMRRRHLGPTSYLTYPLLRALNRRLEQP